MRILEGHLDGWPQSFTSEKNYRSQILTLTLYTASGQKPIFLEKWVFALTQYIRALCRKNKGLGF